MNDKQAITEVAKAPHSEGSFFSLDPGLLIWSWICFFLLLAILGKTTWRPIIQRLKDREAMIARSLNESKEAEILLKQAQKEKQELLDDARLQVSKMINDASSEAKRVAAMIKEDTSKEITEMRKRAAKDIEDQKLQSLFEFRSEMVSIIVSSMEKMLRENIDEKKATELIEYSIKNITKITGQN